jgi:hypothetical protein
MLIRKTGFVIAVMLFCVGAVAAQDKTCEAFVFTVIEEVRKACAEIGRNQACYGNAPVRINPRDKTGETVFAKAGNRIDLAAVEQVATAPLDIDGKKWGVAVMSVRANLPEGGLTLVAQGQVEMENMSGADNAFVALDVTVKSDKGANVRAKADANADLVAQLKTGDTVKAIGRTADGAWIRLLNGWVSADLMRGDGDLKTLETIKADAKVPGEPYGPMQSFRFRSGLDDATCGGAPDSGIVVQTPDGAKDVPLVVNGLSLAVTGTIWLQTGESNETIVSVLEGQVLYGDDQVLLAGKRVQLGAGDNRVKVLFPPEDYYYARAEQLPFILLPRAIKLLFSLGGIVKPFAPGTGFLSKIPPDGPCTIVWTADVNLRGGPGTNYPLRRGVPGGNFARPDAQAKGTDDGLWWRLGEGIWLAANSTFAAGNCAALPLIDTPPVPVKSG